ncbi:glycosyltransferase family 2 protein [Microbacterium laevaniformans]|uniref:Glycosyltransferase family 2 protein n=1 Tax=Microbacterium laevaniformans TaxID=36807 RepID=A0A4S2DEQ3_9MICO|nr:glycosyltransferase [Microbacterium laevaniformans]TGY39263.1 glycosyltransferase family 2 protein [Microbacterium laevaniformans]
MTERPQTAAVQRIRFPWPDQEDSVPLYVRADAPLRWSRSLLRAPARSTVSFDTYFGAFPAGYWRDHASVSHVTLTGRAEGAVRLTLFGASDADSRAVITARDVVDDSFSLQASTDAWAWLWLEVEALEGEIAIGDIEWRLEEVSTGQVAVCITTHNRPSDCVRVLERLAEETTAEFVPQIIVVDQGSTPATDALGWDQAAARLGDRLRYIVQPNLGGSGGYSRGLSEALDGVARYMLLLDDDIVLEPESLSRMVAFADRAPFPTIVGAQMLSLTEPTLLHSYGERVRSRGFWWSPVASDLAPTDLASHTPATTPAMRSVYDVDFNGWWMCLLPRATVVQIGMALPYFIKWDDVEYGLRARAAGTRTVTLPGAAVWHMPWTGKDDGLDWQAYHQLRNRIVTALLHAPGTRGGGVLGASFAQDLNHILCLQYGSEAARAVALRDVLSGPDHLYRTLQTRAEDMRELMRRAGQIVVPDGELPVVGTRPAPRAPRGAVDSVGRLLRIVIHQLRPVQSAGVVSVALDRAAGKWWALGLQDSALVRSATGRGAFVAYRRRRLALSLVVEASVLRLRLWARWPSLRTSYRRALPDLVSRARWEEAFMSSTVRVDTPETDGTE